jgi:hypothetical protein
VGSGPASGSCRAGRWWGAEFHGFAVADAPVWLGELVLGPGEADLESFDLAQPAFAFGLGDPGGQVVADLGQAVALGWVRPKE